MLNFSRQAGDRLFHHLDFRHVDTETSKAFELPGAYPHYTPDRPGKVEHIALDLDLDIPNQRYTGTCTHSPHPVRDGITRLTLDAVTLTIESVMVGSVAQAFDHNGEELSITLSQPTAVGKTILSWRSPTTATLPSGDCISSRRRSSNPTNPTRCGPRGKMKTPATGFPASTIRGNSTTSEIRVRVPKPYQAFPTANWWKRQEGRRPQDFPLGAKAGASHLPDDPGGGRL
jgi:aminopeptidase N